MKALNKAIVLGMARDVRFETPLMWLNKAETWALADHYQNLIWFVRKRSPATTVFKVTAAANALPAICVRTGSMII